MAIPMDAPLVARNAATAYGPPWQDITWRYLQIGLQSALAAHIRWTAWHPSAQGEPKADRDRRRADNNQGGEAAVIETGKRDSLSPPRQSHVL